MATCRESLSQEFAVGICRRKLWHEFYRRYLPREIAVGIFSRNSTEEFSVAVCREFCRGCFPWVFCICKQILFCIREKIFYTEENVLYM